MAIGNFFAGRHQMYKHTVWYTNEMISYAYTVFVLEPFNYRLKIAAIYKTKRNAEMEGERDLCIVILWDLFPNTLFTETMVRLEAARSTVPP